MRKRVSELLKKAKGDDARADELVARAAAVSGDDARPRKNSYLLESRTYRSAARASRRLAEQVATGHVPTAARKKRA